MGGEVQQDDGVTDSPHEASGSDEDAILMGRIASGDEESFRLLVERHQGLVIGTVVRMIGSSEAEDLAQQVFLSVWKSAPRWRPEAKVTTWLLTITKRLVFNESRRRTRSRLLPQSRGEESLPEHPDKAPSPAGLLLERELHESIESALAALPEKERLAVVLRQQQGMPYEEIAAVLGMSLPGVKSLLFRARSSLKERLVPYLGEEN